MKVVPFSAIPAMPPLVPGHASGAGRVQAYSIEAEAQEFMSAYAGDVRAGRRRSISDRYDRKGAYRVGEGEKKFESFETIRAAYEVAWSPPKSFEWKDLSYEAIGPDAVVVAGLFEWEIASGKKSTFSYTGLLVRRDGVLRIRLEDESIRLSIGGLGRTDCGLS